MAFVFQLINSLTIKIVRSVKYSILMNSKSFYNDILAKLKRILMDQNNKIKTHLL